MSRFPRLSFIVLVLTATGLAAAEIPAEPLGEKDQLVLSDDFDRSELGPAWRSPIPAFTVAEGVLKGRQQREDHGATAAATVSLPDGNLVLEVRFRFEGTRSISIACDDRSYSGTHAGHISRVSIRPNNITLYDDKEGVMRNDIYALRKSDDPQQKAEGDRLAAAAVAQFPYKFEPGRWYQLGLEIVGPRMRVTLDGRPVGFLHSPGLAHPVKRDLRISAWGQDQEAQFDTLRIWSVKPAVEN